MATTTTTEPPAAAPTARVMSRPRAAVAGIVAAIAALGVSELLAGLVEEVPSLILGVAEVFVDETPGGIVRWSIDLFGGSQKTLLVIGIVGVTLALGALFGVLTRRSFATGAAGFVAFGVIGAWATGRGLTHRPDPARRRADRRARPTALPRRLRHDRRTRSGRRRGRSLVAPIPQRRGCPRRSRGRA